MSAEGVDVTIGQKVSINGIDVSEDLLMANEEYKLERWGNAGYYIGDAARKILSGKESYAQLSAIWDAEASL